MRKKIGFVKIWRYFLTKSDVFSIELNGFLYGF